MNSNQSANPLAKHFRKPAIYLKLPSGGAFWPSGAINLPENGEIPVFPMTTGDEITLKTPDALMNGAGMVSVIHSCCPNITDAWRMPAVDSDSILIAIRIASYGQNMDITSFCPNCNEENDHSVDLTGLLGHVKMPDYVTPLIHDGLKIKLRPQEYAQVTQSNIITFEETKLSQALTAEDISDEVRNAKLKQSMERIIELNDNLMVKSTEYIEMSDGTRVTESGYLTEFYQNCDAKVTKAVREHLEKLSQQAALPENHVKCSECETEYRVPLEFDYSSFFAIGS